MLQTKAHGMGDIVVAIFGVYELLHFFSIITKFQFFWTQNVYVSQYTELKAFCRRVSLKMKSVFSPAFVKERELPI